MPILSKFLSFVLVGLFISFYQCHNMVNEAENNRYDSIEVHHINIFNLIPNSAIIIDSLINSVKYVQLETTEESIIGSVDELVITDENLIVLDIYQTQSIYIFDKNGNYLRKIQRIGKGSGEYTQPYDIDFNEQTKELYLLNGYPPKIIKYDLEGEFVGEVTLPIRFVSFSVLRDESIVLINDPNNRKYGNPPGRQNNYFSRLYFITRDGKMLKGGGSLNQHFDEINFSNVQFSMMKNEEIVSFYPLFSDTLFEIIGLEAYPQMTFDFGEHKIDEDRIMGLSTEKFMEEAINKEYIYLVGQHAQTTDVLLFFIEALYQKTSYFGIFNKISKKFLLVQFIENGPFNPINLMPLLAYEENFICKISASRLVEIKQLLYDSNVEIKKKILKFTPPQELLDRIDENSNPVLAFYTLRPEKINQESVYVTND